LSSAILYLAIVAIWWLKRDTTQTAKSSTEFAGGPPAEAGRDAHTNGADGEMAESDAGAGPVAADNGALGEVHDYEGPDQRETDPGESRARILSARRRMMLILCTLTVAALGIAMLGLAAWWVTVPPILMLGGYIMLLREASRADTEQVLMRQAAWQDEQDRRRALREAETRKAEAARKEAAEAAAHAPVIDISERVRDELYDQYADEARRAVGD
jgi:hypothetical protein